MSKVIIGTELKLLVNIEPIGTLNMQDYDFDITLACGSINKKTLVFEKRNKPTENNYQCSKGLHLSENEGYIVAFSTNDLGVGKLHLQVKAYIPDGAFDYDANDRKRTEIVEIDTGIEIIKSII